MWEAILLVVVLLVGALADNVGHVPLFDHDMLWSFAAPTGLLAVGLSLSLRTATPNLAVGGIFGMSGALFLTMGDHGWDPALSLIVTTLAGLVFGLLLALGSSLTSTPAWLVSLGGFAVMIMIDFAISSGPLIRDERPVSSTAMLVVAILTIVLSVAGGAVWLFPALRDGLSRNRATAQPAKLPGRLGGAVVGLGVSSAIAALTGGLQAGYLGTIDPSGDTTWLLAGLAAALVGGVSVHGRYGGIAGTILGVYLIVIVKLWLVGAGTSVWIARYLPLTVAFVLGGLVSALIDKVTRMPARQRRPPAPAGFPAYQAFPTPPGFPPPGFTGAGPAGQPVWSGHPAQGFPPPVPGTPPTTTPPPQTPPPPSATAAPLPPSMPFGSPAAPPPPVTPSGPSARPPVVSASAPVPPPPTSAPATSTPPAAAPPPAEAPATSTPPGAGPPPVTPVPPAEPAGDQDRPAN